MQHVAKRNDIVRFVKFDNDIARFEHQNIPAVVAYKGGERIGGKEQEKDLVPLKLDPDSELSAVSLETILRQ